MLIHEDRIKPAGSRFCPRNEMYRSERKSAGGGWITISNPPVSGNCSFRAKLIGGRRRFEFVI